MPGGDRTGPAGAGPMTGRGAGFCAGYGIPGYQNPIPGRGFGMGAGWGRGMGRGFRGGRGRMGYGAGFSMWNQPFVNNIRQSPVYDTAYPNSERDELRELKNQARYLSDTLNEINKRIDQLTTEREG